MLHAALYRDCVCVLLRVCRAYSTYHTNANAVVINYKSQHYCITHVSVVWYNSTVSEYDVPAEYITCWPL